MAPQLDLEAVEKWLYLLHGDCPGYSVVSHPGNWSGRAVSVSSDDWPDQLIGYVARTDRSQPKGIYLRVTTVASPPAEGRRGFTKDSIALPALWLDMDIAGPGHKPIPATAANPNPLPLPPDEDTCLEIIKAADVPLPTLWVHSGGGLYPMWFFKQPIILDGDEDVDTWNDRSQRLHERVHEAAKAKGWHYGLGTHDLARVLRIPGTVNYKVPGAPTQAGIYEAEGFEGGSTFTAEELNFPEVPKPVRELPSSTPTVSTGITQTGRSPVDHYNQSGEVLELLRQHGWEVFSKRGPEWMLVRPGKALRDGPSASWGYGGSRNLYVWSTSAGLPVQEALSPFFLLAHYEHGGNMSAASGHLRREGWGDPLPVQDRGAAEAADRNTILGTITPPPSPPTDNGGGEEEGGEVRKPVIDLTDESEALQLLPQHLGAGTTAHLFLYQEKLVKIPSCDETPMNPSSNQRPMMLITPWALRGILVERFTFIRNGKNGFQSATPSIAFVNTIHATICTGGAPRLRTIRRITRRPIVQPDGTINDEPGFDPTTGIAYFPDPELIIPAVSENPTSEEIASAKSLIDYMLAGFPFVSQEDKNNYLGLLFTPLLTSVVPTPFKLGLISAHQPGSGKTFLAQTILEIYGGSIRPALRCETPGAEEEIRKAITANLCKSEEAVSLWDNLTGMLTSLNIDALISSRRWSDRILGFTEDRSLANDKLWLITGNNIQVGGDTPRRVLRVNLDAKVARPEKRNNFVIKNYLGWIEANKGDVLWSLYTLIAAWRDAGKPFWSNGGQDNFFNWVGVLSGIIRVAGWPGEFDADSTKERNESPILQEWGFFCEAAHSQFGDGEWLVRDLMDRISTSGLMPGKPLTPDIIPLDLLREFNDGAVLSVGRGIGLRLKHLENQHLGGYQLRRSKTRQANGYRWSVHPVVDETSPSTKPTGPPEDLAKWSRYATPTAASTTPTPESAMQRIARLTGPAASDRTDQAVNPTPVDVSHPGEPEQPQLSGLRPVPDVVPDGHPPGPPIPYPTLGPASSPPEP